MTRLAQDDLFAPNAFAVMLAALLAAPDAGFVYCDQQHVDENGKPFLVIQRPPPESALAAGNQIGLCIMWRRVVWEKIGHFNPRYDTVEDYEYWLRLREKFRIIHCPEVLFSFRAHSAMGSEVFSVKQELLTAELKARHARSRAERRQFLSEGFFNAGYRTGEKGERRAAMKYLARAIICRPFWFKPYKSLVRLALRATRPP